MVLASVDPLDDLKYKILVIRNVFIFYCENFGTLKIEIGQQLRKLEIWPPKRPWPHIPHR